jgi:hypothetical protein
MNIPTDFDPRLLRWIAASRKLGAHSEPLITVDLQQLGITERLILQFEKEALALEQKEPGMGTPPPLLMAALAHSRLWILGFYEVLRTYRQRVGRNSTEFGPLSEVFRHLETARMPLAKHEAKGISGTLFYPQPIMKRDVGWVGWLVFEPKTGEPLEIFRTALANEFLKAVETATTDPASGCR